MLALRGGDAVVCPESDNELCANLDRPSLADDLPSDPTAEHRHPASPAVGARTASDAALLRLCRVMTAATIRAGNAQQPPLNSAQVRTLTMLAAARWPLALSDVAECLGSSLTAASAVCAGLVRAGLVHRSATVPEIRLSLTVAGIRTLGAINQDRLRRLDVLLDKLLDADRQAVLGAVERLADTTTGTNMFW